MARIDTIFIIFLYSRHIVITIVIVSYDSFQIIRHCRSRQEEANAMVLQAGAMLWWVPIPNNTLRRRYLPTCWPDSCIICICTCISEPLYQQECSPFQLHRTRGCIIQRSIPSVHPVSPANWRSIRKSKAFQRSQTYQMKRGGIHRTIHSTRSEKINGGAHLI